ncbi:MAG: type I phosphomannose isomerase catalytic subunit [Trueperaceae bacterium]
MNLYPLKLIPQPSERLWGGSRLKNFVPGFAEVPTKEPLGEAWLVYAGNKIANGELAGQTLQHIASIYGAKLLGTKSVERYGDTVPLLAKFLDPSQWLSIQVHPDDTYALSKEAHTGYLGKTEAWYVLDAKQGSQIIWGFKEDVSKQQVREAITNGKLEPLLNYVSVKTGDVIYNPAGMVHALGPDVFIFEIQQSSDLTYRLYDFNRKDSSGNLRELHVDKALEVSSLTKSQDANVSPKKISGGVTELVRSEFFVAEKWLINKVVPMQTDADSLELLTVIEGQLHVKAEHSPVLLNRAESVVLPASLGEYEVSGDATVLRCYVP